MAFNTDNKTANKNQVVLSMVSKASGKTVAWINLVDSFTRGALGEENKNVTAELLEAKKVAHLFESEFLELHVVDKNKPLIQVNIEDY